MRLVYVLRAEFRFQPIAGSINIETPQDRYRLRAFTDDRRDNLGFGGCTLVTDPTICLCKMCTRFFGMLWHAYLRRPRLFPRTFGRGVSKGAIDDRYITTHVWVLLSWLFFSKGCVPPRCGELVHGKPYVFFFFSIPRSALPSLHCPFVLSATTELHIVQPAATAAHLSNIMPGTYLLHLALRLLLVYTPH